MPHFEDPWLFRYLAHPRVLDVIEAFIGPDIVALVEPLHHQAAGATAGGALAHGRRLLGHSASSR